MAAALLPLPHPHPISHFPFSSSTNKSGLWGIGIALPLCHGTSSSFGTSGKPVDQRRRRTGILVSAQTSTYKMNLNEYMVTLEKPLGIRFALSVDGKFFVHSLQKGGNAEKSRIIMVGDTLKKASNSSGNEFFEIKEVADTKKMLEQKTGSLSLVLERPLSPFPIQQFYLKADYEVLFNKGHVPLATWNRDIFTLNGQPSSDGNGNAGFITFSPTFLKSQGRALLLRDNSGPLDSKTQYNTGFLAKHMDEVVGIFFEEECEESEWAYGSFPLEEYIKALDRAKGELYYNHSRGMQYSKITEQIFVGSCIQTDNDVQTLSNVLGITAILNLQTESERANWGINSETINDSCHQHGILMITYPIREVDPIDLRKKLPFCVGLLLRLLRKRFRVFVTCTTGFDRSPACVIAYLHWIQDTALHAAHNFVTGLHSCRPDRAAIVWATWDLIAMVENGSYDGPPTHAVNFIWNNGCREGQEVHLVGDFTGNWKESVKMVHKGGPKYEVELRLRHGRYQYKFIVGGQWRHSTALPTEMDQRGNGNNVIRVGDTARIKFSGPTHQPVKDLIVQGNKQKNVKGLCWKKSLMMRWVRGFRRILNPENTEATLEAEKEPEPTTPPTKDPTVIKVIERPLTEDERFLLAFASRYVAFSICPIRFAPK